MHYSMQQRIPVGVLGASGYAGRELCALVAGHPRHSLAFATANERRGERMRAGATEITFSAADDARLADAELVFSALPHGASAEWVARWGAVASPLLWSHGMYLILADELGLLPAPEDR